MPITFHTTVQQGFNFRRFVSLKVNPFTAILLVLVNLLPIYGVIFQGWDLGQLLLLYWSESGVIGFYNILKILKSNVDITKNLGIVATLSIFIYKFFVSVFFSIHFGIFMLIHLIFIISLFKPKIDTPLLVLITLLSFFVSHGISFFTNFIRKREYLKMTPLKQMGAPYFRVMLMHFTVLLGAFIIQLLGQTEFVLLLFVGLKTISDLYFHGLEHTHMNSLSEPSRSQEMGDIIVSQVENEMARNPERYSQKEEVKGLLKFFLPTSNSESPEEKRN